MSLHVATNHNGQTRLRVNTGSRRVGSPKLHPVAARSSESQPELPPRQQAVVELVCQGLTDKEIATELELSEETIGWYLKRIFPKFGVHSRTALMVRCLQQDSAALPNAPTNVGMAQGKAKTL